MFKYFRRLWWIAFFSLSLWICGSMIQNEWNEWNKNPTKIEEIGKLNHISTIPFPTVTICPSIKIMKSKLNISWEHKITEDNTDTIFTNLSETQ